MEMTIPERLIILHGARERLAGYKRAKEESYQKWLQENDLLLRQIEGSLSLVAENEQQIKADAVAGYALNPDKHPFPGIEIKEFTELQYDAKQALAWAMEHKIALSLDKKSFEFIAKQRTSGTEFVQIGQEYRAQITTDLEKALKLSVETIAQEVK